MRNLYIWLLTLFLFATLSAEAPALMSLKGYLSKDEVANAQKVINQLSSSNNKTLVIEVSSNSGDISQVLDLAKKIYELKAIKQVKVIVYINDNALGPAAIIPFLADQLDSSLTVSWGDIPLGSENTVPTNILRNRVMSLISSDNPHAALLMVLASGMTDSSVQIIDNNGWKIATDLADTSHPVISSKGETLVINHNQLKQLGLISEVMIPEKFKDKFQFSAQQQEQFNLSVLPMTNLAIPLSTVEEKLKDHIKFNPAGPNEIGHIIIEDRTSGITQATWVYVKKALEEYKKTKPIFVILELNTPGGEVFPAQEISDALKELDTQYNIPVVAFINNWAVSAGAMLAYSCRFITVVKDGTMGAAEPVIAGEGGKMEAASEKVNSAMRADFANRARFFDRNPDIAEGMVDKDLILVLRHDKIIKVATETEIRTTGPDPDVIIKAKGKLLTLTSQQLIDYGVADMLLLPKKLEAITPQEQDAGKWPASKMLLFHQPFFDQIPNTVIDSYRMDWKTQFFVILVHPVVSSLLMLGLLVGAYVEITNPGVSLPGSIAAICLFLIILSSLSLEIANWLELIFLFAGLAVILVEVFILPTFGLLGFVGILLFFAGLFGMMLPGAGSVQFDYDTKTLNAAGEAVFSRLAWLCGTLVVGFGIIIVLARYVLPGFSGYSRFILTGGEQDASKGYIAGELPSSLPQLGTKGEAFSSLRPAGKIIINDEVYDAMSSGGFIEKGTPIIVSKLDGSFIVVESDQKTGQS